MGLMRTETLRDTSFRDSVVIATFSLHLLALPVDFIPFVAPSGRDVAVGSLSHKKDYISISHRAFSRFSILRKDPDCPGLGPHSPLGWVTVEMKGFVVKAAWIIGTSLEGQRILLLEKPGAGSMEGVNPDLSVLQGFMDYL